jgi:hypothetical protein
VREREKEKRKETEDFHNICKRQKKSAKGIEREVKLIGGQYQITLANDNDNNNLTIR